VVENAAVHTVFIEANLPTPATGWSIAFHRLTMRKCGYHLAGVGRLRSLGIEHGYSGCNAGVFQLCFCQLARLVKPVFRNDLVCIEHTWIRIPPRNVIMEKKDSIGNTR